MHPSDKNVPDFGCYVALGDSITAGYADGALYCEGQKNSYANILATQLKLPGGFRQPLMDASSVGVDLQGDARMVLEHDRRHPEQLIVKRMAPQGDTGAFGQNRFSSEGPYHNLGIPGAKSVTLLFEGYGNAVNGAGNYNPFFTRMASQPANVSALTEALNMRPTFFSLFIGNNDALAFALSGATADAITPPEGPAGKGFEGSLEAIIGALTATGAKGIVASLPSLFSIPYFTSIPFNGLLLTAEQAAQLNGQWPGFAFTAGRNPFVVSDRGQLRPAADGELILFDLVLEPDRNDYLQAKKAIPKKYTLTASEAHTVEQAIAAYNSIIKRLASKHGLGFADIHSQVKSARTDRRYNPATLAVEYHRHGVFSLDGLHPNAFGQALLANEFIKTINRTFGCAIPTVESRRFKGIVFP